MAGEHGEEVSQGQADGTAGGAGPGCFVCLDTCPDATLYKRTRDLAHGYLDEASGHGAGHCEFRWSTAGNREG